jgi:hypothetical protein
MIHNSSVLVELNISAWTGRKQDKKVSEEIDAAKSTKTKAGNYHKKLLAGTEKLDELQKLVARIRVWHAEQTLPWSDSGPRLLPMKNFFDYTATRGDYEKQFNEEVEDFLSVYPTLVTAAAFQLGDLFDPSEYPSADKLRDKFRFRYVMVPVPEVGDFRIDIGETHLNDMRQQYESFYNTKLSEAMKDVWDRLHETLTKMSERLADAEVPRVSKDGEEKLNRRFNDTLVTNAVELCELLTKLNVTQDSKLEHMRKQLESALVGVTPKELRTQDSLRLETKAKVDEILSMFN